jgi:hypothetical protein
MRNVRFWVSMVSIIPVLLVGLVACSSVASSPDPVQITATPAATLLAGMAGVAADNSSGAPHPVNQLTGQAVDDPAVLQRRPLAAKISNAPALVRPQAGIGAADLVFEHYVEGHLTRFTAIFWTQTPPRIGSIRSARLIDLEIPAMYGAIFAYSGAAEPIRQRIAALPFAPRAYEGVAEGEPLYFRDPAIEAPHNLFAIPAAIWERAAEDGLNDPPDHLDRMLFAARVPDDAQTAQQVTIDYGPDVVRWTYDAASERYWRTVNDERHRDANTGEQISAANVVLIYAHHQEDRSIVESEWQGNQDFSIEIQIWTLGPAVIVRDGRMIEGYWMRWEEDSMLSFWEDEAATQQIALKPGNTWFQVVPLDFMDVRIE